MEEEPFEEDMTIACGVVNLRRFRMEDADDIAEKINDRGISRYTLNIPHPYGPDDAINFMVSDMKWFEEGSALNLAIAEKDFDRVMGGIGLMNVEWQNRACEIGYWLGREHWGRGIMPRAVNGLVGYGFKKLKLHRISAVIFAPNTRSCRVMEKCGFFLEGTLRDRYMLEDGMVDGKVYSILSEDRNVRSKNDLIGSDEQIIP